MTEKNESGLPGSQKGFEEVVHLLEALKEMMNLLMEFIRKPAVNNYSGNISNLNVFQAPVNYNGPVNFYGDNMLKSGTNKRMATMTEVATAARACSDQMWGPASLAVIFGISRDLYHLQENATDYEKAMSMQQLNCPPGTIANTFRHNPYLKAHVSRWIALGAKSRVIKLMEKFQSVMDKADYPDEEELKEP